MQVFPHEAVVEQVGDECDELECDACGEASIGERALLCGNASCDVSFCVACKRSEACKSHEHELGEVTNFCQFYTVRGDELVLDDAEAALGLCVVGANDAFNFVRRATLRADGAAIVFEHDKLEDPLVLLLKEQQLENASQLADAFNQLISSVDFAKQQKRSK